MTTQDLILKVFPVAVIGICLFWTLVNLYLEWKFDREEAARFEAEDREYQEQLNNALAGIDASQAAQQ